MALAGFNMTLAKLLNDQGTSFAIAGARLHYTQYQRFARGMAEVCHPYGKGRTGIISYCFQPTLLIAFNRDSLDRTQRVHKGVNYVALGLLSLFGQQT